MSNPIARISRIVIGEVPAALRHSDPALRHTLGASRQQIWKSAATQFTLASLLIVAAWFWVGAGFTDTDSSYSETVMAVLLLPTILVQMMLSVSVFVTTAGAVNAEKRRGTWTDIRATPEGVALALRGYWAAAVFYRLRGLMLFIYALRLVMIGLLLYDLSGFRGEYIYHMTARVVPEVSPIVGGLLLVITVTAALLMPVVVIAFDAALGLLVAAFVTQRAFLGLARVVIGVSRSIASLMIALVAFSVLLDNSDTSQGVEWGLGLAHGIIGDMGFAYLNAPTLSMLWQRVDYSILLGVVMLLIVFTLALLTDLMIRWAMRRAQRIE